MGGKEIDFKDKKINKKDFYNNKKLFKIKDIDINKILISEAEPYGKKNAKKKQTLLDIVMMLLNHYAYLFSQMIGYFNCFDNSKTMLFLADDKELLKEYTKVWENISDLIGKKFDSEPVYGNKYIKTKTKSYNNSIKANFRGEGNSRKVPKKDCPYKCLSLITLDSVIKMGKKYYPQTLLEECKYKPIKKKTEDLIVDDFDSSSECDGESDGESDSE